MGGYCCHPDICVAVGTGVTLKNFTTEILYDGHVGWLVVLGLTAL